MGCVGLLLGTLHSPFLKAQQNLVQNGSLEVLCNPFPPAHLYFPTDYWWSCEHDWHNGGYWPYSSLYPQSYWGGPDSNGNNILLRSPQSQSGFRHPHSGSGYIGMMIYLSFGGPPTTLEVTNNNRNILYQTLPTPLRAGQRYLLEFFTVLADSSQYSCNRLGLGVRKDSIPRYEYNYNDTLWVNGTPYTPVVTLNWGNPLNRLTQSDICWDSTRQIPVSPNWNRVSGVKLAEGGERFLYMQNFWEDSLTTHTDNLPNVYPSQAYNLSIYRAYAFIDDIGIYALHGGRKRSIWLCPGDTVMGRPWGQAYCWDSEDSTAVYRPAKAGTYWVRSFSDTLLYIDTVEVHLYPIPRLFSQNKITVEPGQEVQLTLPEGLRQVRWQDGSTGRQIALRGFEGWVRVEAITADGCPTSDSVWVGAPYPQRCPVPNLLHLGRDQLLLLHCGGTISLDVFDGFGQLVFSAQAYTGGFPTPGLSPGLYTYRLRQPGVPDQFGKMVLVE